MSRVKTKDLIWTYYRCSIQPDCMISAGVNMRKIFRFIGENINGRSPDPINRACSIIKKRANNKCGYRSHYVSMRMVKSIIDPQTLPNNTIKIPFLTDKIMEAIFELYYEVSDRCFLPNDLVPFQGKTRRTSFFNEQVDAFNNSDWNNQRTERMLYVVNELHDDLNSNNATLGGNL